MIKGDAIICTSNSAYNITIGKKYIIEEVGSLVLNRNKIIIIIDQYLCQCQYQYLFKMDIIVTIPKSIVWSDYERELKEVEDFTSVMNFKTPHFPKTSAGEKCYLLYNALYLQLVRTL